MGDGKLCLIIKVVFMPNRRPPPYAVHSRMSREAAFWYAHMFPRIARAQRSGVSTAERGIVAIEIRTTCLPPHTCSF